MIRHMIVVDVETNGLDFARHEAVEVAWWNLATDERGQFIPRHDVAKVLAAADVKALQVNRYIDRIADQRTDRDHTPAFDALLAVLRHHTLAGSNPAFDARMLMKLYIGRSSLTPPPWHHRLWDLSAYAAGVLGLDELPGLARVCELLNIPAPDHTAAGDVTATGRCFRALFLRATPPAFTEGATT